MAWNEQNFTLYNIYKWMITCMSYSWTLNHIQSFLYKITRWDENLRTFAFPLFKSSTRPQFLPNSRGMPRQWWNKKGYEAQQHYFLQFRNLNLVHHFIRSSSTMASIRVPIPPQTNMLTKKREDERRGNLMNLIKCIEWYVCII